MIPFVALDDPAYGVSQQVSPLVRRVIARNPSKFTYHGTGTYIVGPVGGPVAVIDPGPIDDDHRLALETALRHDTVIAILVTHCHADHSPLAAWLRESSGAPTKAFGPHHPDPETSAVAAEGPTTEESIDRAFRPDQVLSDGEIAAEGPGWSLTAVHTPGHTSNHLCFSLSQERALFTGDHIMGWSTTVVAPPNGNMRDYINSLGKVLMRSDETLWPTHGAPVVDPQALIRALIDHRYQRESQILELVRQAPTTISPIVAALYADVSADLHQPAAFSVLAHLVMLVQDGLVQTDGPPQLDSVFSAFPERPSLR